MQKPKFEKVNDNTIRITVEKSNDVPLANLVENRKKLLEQKSQLIQDLTKNEEIIDQTIKNIDEILTEAKKLGIVAKEPKKDLPNFIVDGICKKDEKTICNLGYACDGCPYNKDVKK